MKIKKENQIPTYKPGSYKQNLFTVQILTSWVNSVKAIDCYNILNDA